MGDIRAGESFVGEGRGVLLQTEGGPHETGVGEEREGGAVLRSKRGRGGGERGVG